MRSGKFSVVGVAVLLLVASVAVADQAVVAGGDTAPWHISKVARLSTARDGAAAAAEAAPQKYLHIEVRFNTPADAQKKHKFRVVNERGDEVGDLWGWNDGRSLVIFEGKWGSLTGLYLDGNGHREPLFSTVAAPAPVVRPVVTYTPPVVRQPNVYVAPRQDDVVVRDREYVDDRRLIVEPRDQVPRRSARSFGRRGPCRSGRDR